MPTTKYVNVYRPNIHVQSPSHHARSSSETCLNFIAEAFKTERVVHLTVGRCYLHIYGSCCRLLSYVNDFATCWVLMSARFRGVRLYVHRMTGITNLRRKAKRTTSTRKDSTLNRKSRQRETVHDGVHRLSQDKLLCH